MEVVARIYPWAMSPEGRLKEIGGVDGPVAVLALDALPVIFLVDIFHRLGNADVVGCRQPQVPEKLHAGSHIPRQEGLGVLVVGGRILIEENGETVVYDFGDMPNFAEKIYAVIESTSEVEVNGMPAKKYHLSTLENELKYK